MIVAWPRGIEAPGWERGARPLTAGVLLLALLLRLAASRPWSADSLLDRIADWGVWLKLYSDPSAGLFRPWQIWSANLVHAGWGLFAIAALAWWIFAGACERRLGSLLFALLLVLVAPVWATVPVLLGAPVDAIGLLPLAVACAAGLLAVQPRARLRGRCAFWLGRWAGLSEWRLRSGVVLLALLAAAVVVQLVTTGGGIDAAGVMVVAALLAAAVAGQLAMVAFIGVRDAMLLRGLLAIAAGQASLARLPRVLATLPAAPPAVVERAGERALAAEDPAAVAACAAHLRRQRPESGLLARLTEFLRR